MTNAYYGNNPPAAAGGSYKPYGTMQTANSWDNRASTSASAGQASAAYSRRASLCRFSASRQSY